ncbi:MAG: type II toxin-antitoxin system mRNA interferase toxin, RelE/StbE family [Desulfovibrionaceae bacterium]|nr:type II toxin-antitoxin system mRNA interferase toxin, RelE/StbE family [Desulfovibrionaceae bacterium]
MKGRWKKHRELHIEPDWLLVYSIDGNECFFARTGTHSDIFNE